MSLNRFKNDITEVKINRIDTFKDEIEVAMFLYICVASKNNNYNYLRFEREEILNTILKMDLNYLTVGEIASFILRVKKYKWQGLDLEEVFEDKDVKDFLISLSAEMDNKEIQKTMISRFNLETIIKVIEKLRKAYLIRKAIKALEREDVMLNIEKDIMELDNIVKEKVPITNKVFYREESYDLIMEEKDQIEDILQTDTVLDVVLKLFKQEIFLISGEPGTGKTSFVLDIALKLEKAGHRGIFFSLEMGKKAIGNRALSIQTSIPTEEFLSAESLKKFIESFEKDKQDIFYKRIEKFRTKVKKLEIVDTTGISVDYIEEYVNNSIALSGKLDYIVVDYLQLLNGKGNNTTEIITYISKRLKEIAKKYNIVVIATVQMNTESKKELQRATRGEEKTYKLYGTSLKGSSQLDQDAGAILFLTKIADDEVYKQRLLNLQISKQRNYKTFDDLELEFLLPNQVFKYTRLIERFNYVKPKKEIKEQEQSKREVPVVEQQKML